MTVIYRGQSDVVRWCQVSNPPVVSNWLKRYPDDAPQPDAAIVNEGSTWVTRGWLAERRPEWEAFAALRRNRPGNAAKRAKTAARMIIADMEAGTIKPADAARLLRELI